jgi:putative transposase
MRGKRFTEEQIVSILKESAAGMKTDDLCRRHGICQNTYYRWRPSMPTWKSRTSVG